MMTRESGKKREQIQLMSLDDLVPQDHLVRKSEAALDRNFIYELVEEKCSEDSERPSIDPVVLIKLLVIQYIFGLRSMRQTIREAEVNTAYRVQTACDAKGIILGYSVHPGNENDGRTFPEVLEKLGHLPAEIVVGDTAYKTPAIAHLLKSKGIKLLSTYGRPKTKKGFFPKHEYVYDEYYDCYICPNNQLLHYATTNREYRSCGAVFAGCPYPAQCTNSKEHVKTITWHMWAADLEEMEENRCTCGIREYYKLRKEAIERDFALAKELHGFRYTQEYGQARMAWKAALAFACINLKKLARMAWNTPYSPHFCALSA